jgi:hypothetical protein
MKKGQPVSFHRAGRALRPPLPPHARKDARCRGAVTSATTSTTSTPFLWAGPRNRAPMSKERLLPGGLLLLTRRARRKRPRYVTLAAVAMGIAFVTTPAALKIRTAHRPERERHRNWASEKSPLKRGDLVLPRAAGICPRSRGRVRITATSRARHHCANCARDVAETELSAWP